MGMFGGGMDKLLGPMLEQFKRDFAKAREELKETTLEASAGGGVITAKANGESELLEITISSEALQDADAEMLQDMIVAAVREVQDEARKLKGEKLGGLFGGMGAFGLDPSSMF